MNAKSRGAIAEVLAEDKKPLVSPAVSEHAMLESVPQLRARIEDLELDLAEAHKKWLRAMGSAAELERQLDALKSSQAGFALVPVERSYEMRVAAILHYNTAKQSGKDHDDALDAAWRATLKKAHGPDGVIAGAAAEPPVCDLGYGHAGSWCGPRFNCWLDPRPRDVRNATAAHTAPPASGAVPVPRELLETLAKDAGPKLIAARRDALALLAKWVV